MDSMPKDVRGRNPLSSQVISNAKVKAAELVNNYLMS